MPEVDFMKCCLNGAWIVLMACMLSLICFFLRFLITSRILFFIPSLFWPRKFELLGRVFGFLKLFYCANKGKLKFGNFSNVFPLWIYSKNTLKGFKTTRNLLKLDWRTKTNSESSKTTFWTLNNKILNNQKVLNDWNSKSKCLNRKSKFESSNSIKITKIHFLKIQNVAKLQTKLKHRKFKTKIWIFKVKTWKFKSNLQCSKSKLNFYSLIWQIRHFYFSKFKVFL